MSENMPTAPEKFFHIKLPVVGKTVSRMGWLAPTELIPLISNGPLSMVLITGYGEEVSARSQTESETSSRMNGKTMWLAC
jgi:hypothetical protein